jgi:hypothetical protein
MIQGLFFGLPVATLQKMQSQWQDCLTAIATAHQSYSIAGRQFTRANLAEVSQMLGEVTAALNRATGSTITTVYSDMSNS